MRRCSCFSEAVQTCFEGERVWLHSRNVPVAEIEDKLLRKVQEAPFSKYIRIEKSARLTQKEDQAEFIQGLPADFIVAADGAASLSRRAFPDKFVCPHSRGFNIEEQRIRLADTEDGCVHADHVLGIILQQDARPPQEQSLNVNLHPRPERVPLKLAEGFQGLSEHPRDHRGV